MYDAMVDLGAEEEVEDQEEGGLGLDSAGRGGEAEDRGEEDRGWRAGAKGGDEGRLSCREWGGRGGEVGRMGRWKRWCWCFSVCTVSSS